jgi:hypothetical protein
MIDANNKKQYIIDTYKDDERIVSLMALYNGDQKYPNLTGFDMMILIVTDQQRYAGAIYHYIEDGLHVQERWVSSDDLQSWLFDCEKRQVIQWIFDGDILIDRTGYLKALRDRLIEFDEELRGQKLLKEFSLFLSTYSRSKEYLKQGYLLDAYSQILAALHHWARITVIEAGTHPEVIVWKQVHKINPGVYKLYDELTHSEETLEQRIQLLALACEFAVMSKMKECCGLLIKIMKSREGSWSVKELAEHPLIRDMRVDLSLVLKKLVAKSIVKEVFVTEDAKLNKIELQYCAV